MNNLNNSADEVIECPLCMEPLEVDDINFFPCTCGYQICRFCWHRIRTDENELCPACRKEYPENPADFKPLTQEEMIAFKSQKRQRDQQRKQKITENRKHLANVRVVQKNLVFVVGLPPRLADADVLKKHEYFGKYGKIHKVVINPSTTYAGIQGPSASAYVTYVQNTDALRAIQSVNNIMIDGRLIKTSLGTTKYCSHFMKNQQCPKGDCMYLHELGDPDASFTKEEMHQGKHQEYEKRLHDFLIASGTASGCTVSLGNSNSLCNSKTSENCKNTGIFTTPSTIVSLSSSTAATNNLASVVSSAPQKEAWPSLSISPINQKDFSSTSISKNKKERTKQEKNKSEKNTKTKNNKTCITTRSINLPKDLSVVITNSTLDSSTSNNNQLIDESTKYNFEKSKENNQGSLVGRLNQNNVLPNEINLNKCSDNKFNDLMLASLKSDNYNRGFMCNKLTNDNDITNIDNQCFLGSSSNSGSCCIATTTELNSMAMESVRGQRSPETFNKNSKASKLPLMANTELDISSDSNISKNDFAAKCSKSYRYIENFLTKHGNTDAANSKHQNNESMENNRLEKLICTEAIQKEKRENDSIPDMSKLNIFDENSFFSVTTGSLPDSMPMKLKRNEDMIQNLLNTGTSTNLPDLINDVQASSNNYLNGSDLSRQSSYLQYQLQSKEPLKDIALNNSLFGTNMSKFFDFHKHQQHQKLKQQSIQINNQIGGVNENLHMMPLLEHNRINSQLLDNNCILAAQHHQQKQQIFGKKDQMLCHQAMHQLTNQQTGPVQGDQNQFIQNSTGDDDLGFDPFIETQKALAELIETEEEQQNIGTTTFKFASHKQDNNLHLPHEQNMMKYMQRPRMPPPGFNHVNNFNDYNNIQITQNSKLNPFINLSNNYTASTSQPIQHPQIQIPSNAWSTHLGSFQQHMPDQQTHQVNSNHIQSNANLKGCTGSNDWTAMDPAILSFRQFSFSHQPSEVPPNMQSQQHEMFLQQLTGFYSQPQHLSGSGGNASVPNTMMNLQQNSQPHVNENVQGMLEYLKTHQFV